MNPNVCFCLSSKSNETSYKCKVTTKSEHDDYQHYFFKFGEADRKHQQSTFGPPSRVCPRLVLIIFRRKRIEQRKTLDKNTTKKMDETSFWHVSLMTVEWWPWEGGQYFRRSGTAALNASAQRSEWIRRRAGGSAADRKGRDEQGEMDFLPSVIYDQSSVHLQIHC